MPSGKLSPRAADIAPSRHRSLRLLIAALACVLAILTRSDARVFTRWSAAARSDKALEHAGGRHAYHAGLNINGADASLTVFGFNVPVTELTRTVTRLFPSARIVSACGTLSLLHAQDGDTVTRMVLVGAGEPDTAVLIKLDQQKDDFLKSTEPPDRNLMPAGIPELPGGQRRFFASNNDTGMSLAVLISDTEPQAIYAYYEARLASDGWNALLPGTGSARVFLKDEDFCCVMVSPEGTQNRNAVTIVHKIHEIR